MENRIRSVLSKAGALCYVLMAWPLAYVLKRLKKRPNLWLICERPDEARDNGYHFFSYVRRHHPEVHARYVIHPWAPDHHRVARLGPVLSWGSFRHYLHWFMADCLISAHPGACAPEPNVCWRMRKFGLARQRSVNLKHGVIATSMPDYMYRVGMGPDLISAASPTEREFLVRDGGHPDQVVRLLGLCRFDALHEPALAKRQVLLMPTWRRWFRDLAIRYGLEEAMNIFRDSDYHRAFAGFLGSLELRKMLESHDYRLVFYPHHGTQPFLEAFHITHDRITIADRHRYDVQPLLKESRVLITDFSSVSFDFAYMLKPVVYLLPDEERYFREHFRRAYFDFERDGFGPVARSWQEAVEALRALLETGGVLHDGHRERIRRFFPVRDASNCERTYRAVGELMNPAHDRWAENKR